MASLFKNLLFTTAIVAPTALVSAYSVTYEGYYQPNCGFEVNYGNFSAPYNCWGFEIWPVSSYKLYSEGPVDCPEGTSLQITFYAQQAGDQYHCGIDPLLVLPIGESQDCVEGLNISPAIAEVTCA
ncbi:hypothetical protein TSTA_115250 [Talaromyces stipitatus ATCC 10500]|uniref:Uncharacterized protein n=1 Tax=Talaromyces stipitatus (strain ATCC 10500 / CBS 375.48 / QM 6759 / NRRL 1006) TaxID=441959 RepID=B8M9G6_TALSN|nr:uncharacterized protein TSTA_115250 [Talaromyces stipitatus ATCC 10500]EED17726.1 hypothetical protein TSTA_115250 [Talaromyces stipitatus ATCC 10500]